MLNVQWMHLDCPGQKFVLKQRFHLPLGHPVLTCRSCIASVTISGKGQSSKTFGSEQPPLSLEFLQDSYQDRTL